MHRQIFTLTIATLVAATIAFPAGATSRQGAAAAIATSSRANTRAGSSPTLARDALPLSAVPGSMVDQGYGTAADVAAAGAGIVATYERTFTYPSATNPPYAFVDEELWAANGLARLFVASGNVIVGALTASDDNTDSGNTPGALALLKPGLRHLGAVKESLANSQASKLLWGARVPAVPLNGETQSSTIVEVKWAMQFSRDRGLAARQLNVVAVWPCRR
jgi:hypothetical protein